VAFSVVLWRKVALWRSNEFPYHHVTPSEDHVNAPAGTFGSNRIVRTVGLVVLGLVVLCGVCGSCLFMVSLLLPLFTGGKP
jgi:hypothetical protein